MTTGTGGTCWQTTFRNYSTARFMRLRTGGQITVGGTTWLTAIKILSLSLAEDGWGEFYVPKIKGTV